MASKTQTQQDTQKNQNQTTANVNNTWQKFWFVKPCNTGELKGLHPFIIQEYLTHNIGENLKTKKLLNGNLLVEVNNEKQARKLKQNKQIHDINTFSEPHRSLNVRKGVVKCAELDKLTEEKLVRYWAKEGVSHVKRIHVFRDGTPKPTSTLILTFETHELPTHIWAGYLRLPVTIYIPQPLRCFKCQKYGHHQSACKGKAACQVCSGVGHDSKTCGEKAHCMHCEGDHPPSSRSCPRWKQEKEVCRVKAERNVSYPEARRLCKPQTNVAGKLSYAQATAKTSVVSKSTVSVQTTTKTTQTDTTWLELPEPVLLDKCSQTDISTQTSSTETNNTDNTQTTNDNQTTNKSASQRRTKHDRPGPKFTKTFFTPPSTPMNTPTKKRPREQLSPELENLDRLLQGNKFRVLSFTDEGSGVEEEPEVDLKIHPDSEPPSGPKT